MTNLHRRCALSIFLVGSAVVLPSLTEAQQATPSKTADSSTMDLEQLMKIEIVVAGSKYTPWNFST